MDRRRVVTVPGSSANLGPGFDAMAAALGVSMRLEVEETGRFAVETDLAIATDHRNLAVRGFERLAPTGDFAFRISSEIPLSGGLGTSAAAYVAGLMAADSIFELDADLLAHASVLEGHPDNVAASLLGGFVLCLPGPPVQAIRFEPPAGLEAILVVPGQPVRTKEARAALPAEVPMRDAVFNASHAALLTMGLIQGDWDLVARGLKDRLHQDRRAHLFPRSAALLTRAVELGALGATISGAGPTVLVWTHYEQTGGVHEALRREADGWAQVMRVPFESQGAAVTEH